MRFNTKDIILLLPNPLISLDWYSANMYCQNCNICCIDGFHDWRLPTVDDFFVIKNNKKLKFLEEEDYWTSDDLPSIISYAFIYNVHYEQKELVDKQLQYPFFLVRDDVKKRKRILGENCGFI